MSSGGADLDCVIDTAVMMGAVTQVRVLGGTISLAVWYVSSFYTILHVAAFRNLSFLTESQLNYSSILFNNHVKSKLPGLLDPSRIAEISESLSATQNLPSDEQIAVRTVYAEGYNKQNILQAAFSGIAFLSCLLLWEKNSQATDIPTIKTT